MKAHEFRKKLNEYFRDTSDDQIWLDIKLARPVKVPPQVHHEGFEHTGVYRSPKSEEWYQSWGPQNPKWLTLSDSNYDKSQCRWILRKIKTKGK